MPRVAILLLPVLLCAGFLGACGGGGSARGPRTLSIRAITVDGKTITRVVIPATVATTEPDIMSVTIAKTRTGTGKR